MEQELRIIWTNRVGSGYEPIADGKDRPLLEPAAEFVRAAFAPACNGAELLAAD
jgi:hypothetical protein